MTLCEQFVICGCLLLAVGAFLCISEKTKPVGIGVIASSVPYALFAVIALLCGI